MFLSHMKSRVYTKGKTRNIRKIIRFTGLGVSLTSLIVGLYIFFPLISWELYMKPVFASQSFATPIPKTTVITKQYIESLLDSARTPFLNGDYSNVQNWFPSNSYKGTQITGQTSSYSLSIPKLTISNAYVSTLDTNVDMHLVHFPGTALPPSKGTAAVFGHSTLPQLFDPTNYKTIFAKAHTLAVDDTIDVAINNAVYTYRIITINVVDAEDTSYLTQEYNDSYLTIITCTPPGTVWKRLIIKSKLEKI
jgi:sortase A